MPVAGNEPESVSRVHDLICQVHKQRKRQSQTEAVEKTWIMKYLYYTGILISTMETKIGIYYQYCRFWFPALVHIALLANTALLTIESFSGVYGMHVVVACECVNILSVALWHCTYRVKHELIEMLVKLQKICSLTLGFRLGKIEVLVTNAALVIFSITPTAFSLMFLCFERDTSTDTFWTFGYKLGYFNHWGKLIIFVNVNLYVSLQVVFPGLVTCVYCSCCHRFSKLITCCNNNLEIKVEACIKQKVSQYIEILNGIELLQRTFSKPIFLLVSMHVIHMFALLAYFLTFTKDQFTGVVIGESVVITSTSSLSICAVVLFAARIPESIHEVKQRYQLFQENMVFKSSQRDEIIQLAIDREVVVMSAGGFVQFQKSFILSVFGALLTYGLLILQLNR
ncbi:hypothetical protein JTE90_006468 [Oedothorax gibbosus]|uniref:Gustatory receptor n=1 Tax=Oedothorax gibbosus TaxID=931172 RepID=A0AAV6UGE9_9ARAC|nr:hypothetical protein JTE90_006468 [Oedothorax gibbosus]